jgi:CTP synthase
MKYVVVTGGVVSGLGKGITASSIGVLLKGYGYKVTCIKIDPYLNIDAGTMSPFEHGEVYVLDDGGEVDLDMGNYERFLNLSLTKDHNITTGKIYKRVLDKERNGAYLGKTVQVIPHITNEVVQWIERVAHQRLVFSDDKDVKELADVCIIELGGTIGDIESGVYVEALRQLETKVGAGNFACVHVGLVPTVVAGGEQKSKPTQQSISMLRSLGLTPCIVALRCNEGVCDDVRCKIAIGAGLSIDRVVSIPNVENGNLWKVPLTLVSQNVHIMLRQSLRLYVGDIFDLLRWRVSIVERWEELMDITDESRIVCVGVVGKYTNNSDAYLSITRALQHACMTLGVRLSIKWIESTALEACENVDEMLGDVNGVLIPGGFGQRGIDGMVKACEYCRLYKVPFFGICLGMQVAVIEYFRNVLGIKDATSEEFADNDANEQYVVKRLEISDGNKNLGGTMHLGLYATVLKDGTHAQQSYGCHIAYERHRHRYGVYGGDVELLEANGVVVSGRDSEQGDNAIVIEMDHEQHPFYVACQFHPEYKTRPLTPSPLFMSFIVASIAKNISIM